MSLVCFWDYGDGGSADVAAAAAIYHTLTKPGKVLLLNGGKAGEGIENGLRRPDDRLLELGGGQHLPEHGIEALIRLQMNQRLSSNVFRDYTYSLIADRLDIVSGFNGGSTYERLSENSEIKRKLYQVAEQIYDVTVVQTSLVCQDSTPLFNSDIRIAVLNQNRMQLERYFRDSKDEYLHEGTCGRDLLLLKDFDSKSKWTVNNIRRRYKTSIPIIPLEYSTDFRDAVNNRELLKFLYFHRSRPLRKRNDEPVLSGLSMLLKHFLPSKNAGELLSAASGEGR